ncbi:MAG: hypothetical protein ACYCQI_00035 [Gammaproteobacteria bacterium]
MVDEKEDSYELSDEGEYHFSDEEANYETAPATSSVAAAAAPNKNAEKAKAILTKFRRPIIGVLVFFILIFVVYKMLAPTSVTPATEINPSAVTKPIAKEPLKPAKPLVPAATEAPQPPAPEQTAQALPPQPAEPIAAPSAPPMAQAQMPSAPQPQVQAMPPAPGAQPQMNLPPQAQSPGAPVNPMQTAPISPPVATTMNMAPPAPQAQPQPMPQETMAMPSNPSVAPPGMVTESAPNKMMMDRLATLEEQNTKLMNLLQTQVAQKIAEYQAENTALKERVLVLNKRLVNMETSINKISQLILDQGASKAPPMMAGPPGFPPPKAMLPKMVYTVQAIIPGRAWLKSEGGDTITVAEGDVLKDYGRVTKIDPYDGLVEIDTGNKVVSLSYGTSGD